MQSLILRTLGTSYFSPKSLTSLGRLYRNRQVFTRARLLDNTDIVRFRAEREAKNVTKKTPSKRDKRSKKAASPMPSPDSTEIEG